jgi:radical SAM protein with 4Fe4S-binding SPASM domain
MSNGLYGLANLNIELTSRCNKNCWICGRRRIEKEYPELALNYGDMAFPLVERIAAQLPAHIVVQLHNNGEGLLYPRFGEALKLFKNQVTNIVTNGKLLLEKADEIIGNLDTLAVSVIEKDPETDEQFEIIRSFLKLKKECKPYMVLRINGEVDVRRYEKLNLLMVRRALHSALGSFNYLKTSPTIPEIGICLDFLHHLAINKDGKVSICVRFDPQGVGVIGDAETQTLEEIWNSPLRLEWLAHHKEGRRDLIPLCSYCHFWGVPTAGSYETSGKRIDESSVFRK